MKHKHSFIVSRFQPFHKGHKFLVDKMLQDSEFVTIVLGSAQESRTEKNPFSVEERTFMLKNVYGELPNMYITSLDDIDDDNLWIKTALQKVNESDFPKPDAFYCGGEFEGSFFKDLKIEMYDRNQQKNELDISGTRMREMIKLGNQEWKKFIPKKNISFVEYKLLHQ